MRRSGPLVAPSMEGHVSITIRATPKARVSAAFHHAELRLNVHREGERCVVDVVGEVDVASHNQLFVASTAGDHPAMVIDLAGVTFMDCSGYGSLIASRLAIESEGRTLAIRGQVGQPARLFDLIATMESGRPASRSIR